MSSVVSLLLAGASLFGNATGDDFTLRSFDGTLVSLREGEPRATVLVFTSAECPVAKLYAPRLAEMERAYRSQGVRFLAIDANFQDDPAKVAAAAQQAEIASSVLLDPDQTVADRFAVKRSPETIVLDRDRQIRYRGAVDDQYGVGAAKDQPTARYLGDALDAVLAGRDVLVPTSTVAGCLLGRMPDSLRSQPLTFYRDVLPIVQHNCQVCHRPGEIGPMPLISYKDVAAWAPMIVEVIGQGRMPPWHADPVYGQFSNRRGLTDREKDQLARWAEAGAPEGDPHDAPPPVSLTQAEWHIGAPDLVLAMQKPFSVPAQGTVDYKYFRVPTGLEQDRWVSAIEVKPGNRGVVHHILVFVEEPRHRRESLDQFQGGLNGYFGVFVPGQGPAIYPSGMAKRLPRGSNLIFQVHYTPNGTRAEDVSSVGFRFTDEEITQQVVTRGIFNLGITIPPGKRDVEFRASYTFDQAASLLDFFPHMHLRGQSFRYELVQGERHRTLLSVPKYDFRWQHLYRLAEPIPVEPGDKIVCTAAYDNTKGNPNNPNPAATVRWGDQTWEEMLLGYLDFVVDE
ncbi:MAG: redoxin domain-containing protein [Planctomycetota bacterium]